MPSLVLRPGTFIRLKQQPIDLPDFILEHCSGRECWVRQQSWGPHVYLRIQTIQIEIREKPVRGILPWSNCAQPMPGQTKALP
ncbi:MAG: hypothetical protein AAFV72_05705 [Cyanobacteria bacterium J06635_1]